MIFPVPGFVKQGFVSIIRCFYMDMSNYKLSSLLTPVDQCGMCN